MINKIEISRESSFIALIYLYFITLLVFKIYPNVNFGMNRCNMKAEAGFYKFD